MPGVQPDNPAQDSIHGVKGSTQGATTSGEGTYSLSADGTNTTLVFSFVGYQTREEKVGNRSVLDVSLTPDAKALGEVVVIGYGTTSCRNLTTSVAKVDPKTIPSAANLGIPDLLFGRAAGVNVTKPGCPPTG